LALAEGLFGEAGEGGAGRGLHSGWPFVSRGGRDSNVLPEAGRGVKGNKHDISVGCPAQGRK
jgi:hypothetical protein